MKLNVIQRLDQKLIFSFSLIDVTNMKTYCLKCKKDTDNIDSKIFKTKNNRLIMQSKCSVCKSKKSRFVKEQETKGLLSNLGIQPFAECFVLSVKMNNIINKYLLTGDTFMPEMHLKQP